MAGFPYRPARLAFFQLSGGAKVGAGAAGAGKVAINPNNRSVVHVLMREGLIVRSCGMLTIWLLQGSRNFCDRSSSGRYQELGETGAGIHADALRTSLLVAGTALAIFLFSRKARSVDASRSKIRGWDCDIDPRNTENVRYVWRSSAAGPQVS